MTAWRRFSVYEVRRRFCSGSTLALCWTLWKRSECDSELRPVEVLEKVTMLGTNRKLRTPACTEMLNVSLIAVSREELPKLGLGAHSTKYRHGDPNAE